MTDYTPSYRDIEFSLLAVNAYNEHLDSLNHPSNSSMTDVNTILQEYGRFCQEVLAPLNQSGDKQGAKFSAGKVTVPKGFKEAYDLYVKSGWPRLSHSETWGGIAMPYSVKIILSELTHAANSAWGMYVMLNDGVVKTITSSASQNLIDAYVPQLVSGEWLGTMCLTEPQCGSDLNLVKTKAEPTRNGSYRITGNKIFISSGEHQMTDNIVHLVLAKLPNAPEGTRGISLFIVPKRKLNADGSLGEINPIHCVSVEHKMGLKGSATCAMSFEGAEGWLVGEPNRGLNNMFVLVNKSRLGVAQQAIAQMDASHQTALAYAHERMAGRAPEGKVYPEQPADPLICQPDVRRMLMSQKAIAEAGRSLTHWCGKYVDLVDCGTAEQQQAASRYLGLLIPIAKGCLSELASEMVDYGIQVLGGHGYVSDLGVEQRLRDVRVTRIYEGTTCIQGMDLLQRKILGRDSATFDCFLNDLLAPCTDATRRIKPLQQKLVEAVSDLKACTATLAEQAQQDAALVPAVAVDYLMVVGYVTLAHLWVKAALAAEAKWVEGDSDDDFYKAKLETAEFYFTKLLPRVATHYAMIDSGSAALRCDAALNI